LIIITGRITATPENFEELRTQILAHVRRSRTEDGCERHSVRVDADNGLRPVLAERRRDRVAVLRFFADPDARSFAARWLAAELPGDRDPRGARTCGGRSTRSLRATCGRIIKSSELEPTQLLGRLFLWNLQASSFVGLALRLREPHGG
jgi:quinol monooxygenase YgiN